MANRIVSVHAGIYGKGTYAIMLPSSGFSVAHCEQKSESAFSGTMYIYQTDILQNKFWNVKSLIRK